MNKKRISTTLKGWPKNKKNRKMEYITTLTVPARVRALLQVGNFSEFKIVSLRVVYNSKLGYWNEFDFVPDEEGFKFALREFSILTEKSLIDNFS